MKIEKQSNKANESVEELVQRAITQSLLNVIKEELHRMDPLLPRSGATFRTAVVLVAAASLGLTDVDHLVSFTNYPRPVVAKISAEMHASGLWTDDGVCTEFFLEGDAISPRLWVGCLVAAGVAVVSKREDGTWGVRRVPQTDAVPQNSSPASQP